VVPAAHYMCGGVVTDDEGRTSIENLYACGETACTGIHGANRLASNSLPEAWIFASRAAETAVLCNRKAHMLIENQKVKETKIKALPVFSIKKISKKKAEIQKLMWEYVGIGRTIPGLLLCREKLEQLLTEITQLKQQFGFSIELQELQNLAQVGLLITEAALHRPGSVGCHFLEPLEVSQPVEIQ
jgi:L-aspartate oxidase